MVVLGGEVVLDERGTPVQDVEEHHLWDDGAGLLELSSKKIGAQNDLR